MKETDFNEIYNEISTQETDIHTQLIERLGTYKTKLAIMAIYLTNDLCSGYGQDFKLDEYADGSSRKLYLSVISSANKISVILDGVHSYYKMDDNICAYESLTDDISTIILCLNTAFNRVMARL